MKHGTARKKLIDYMEGELPADTQEALRRHLNSCAECRSFLQKLEDLWNPGKSVPEPSPPDHMWSKISSSLELDDKSRTGTAFPERLAPYLKAALTTSAVIATVIIGVQLGLYFNSTTDQPVDSRISRIPPEEEWGMDYFSVNPPGSMSVSLLSENVEQEDKK